MVVNVRHTVALGLVLGDGAGPETVLVEWPETEGSYRVAVHAWDDHGYGPSAATVRVRVFEQLVYERTATLESGDLWCVGLLEWPEGTVRPCEAPGGAPRITPDYPRPSWLTGSGQAP